MPTPWTCDSSADRPKSRARAAPGCAWITRSWPASRRRRWPRLRRWPISGQAIGWDYSPAGGAYINTDVTLQLLRAPAGEWFYFDAATIGTSQGLAATHTAISDQHGQLGWVVQSQVEAPAEIGFPGGMNAARQTSSR